MKELASKESTKGKCEQKFCCRPIEGVYIMTKFEQRFLSVKAISLGRQ